MSQVDRVLALLRSRGDRGLCTAELQEIPVADGGRPILRLAARVHQLQQQGFGISSTRGKDGTSTYRLVSEPSSDFPAGRIPPRTEGSTGIALAATHSSESSAFGNRAAIYAKEIPGVRHAGEGLLFDVSGLEKRPDYRDEAA